MTLADGTRAAADVQGPQPRAALHEEALRGQAGASCTTRCARSTSIAICSTAPGSAQPRTTARASTPRSDRYWLFIENVVGDALWQVGEFDVWEEAARWLARMHGDAGPARGRAAGRCCATTATCSASGSTARAGSPTIRAVPGAPTSRQRVRDAGRALRRRRRAAGRARADLHPRRVLSLQRARAAAVAGRLVSCPIDWEIAAVGPGLLDLAALSVGKWTDAERAAWRSPTGRLPRRSPRPPRICRTTSSSAALDCCRLHLAVQWLGWEPRWEPPAEHRHDWLGEALTLAERLGV